MSNDKLHNDLKQLSAYVYRDGETQIPDGWISVTSEQDKKNGFYAETFYKDGQVAVVYRGSDDAKDWAGSNLAMGADIQPAQKVDAERFYENAKEAFPNQTVVVAGHSLGGSLAQIVGSETGAQTATFNAYGTGDIMQDAKYKDNITNYGNADDPVFISNIDNQIGKTLVIKDGNTDPNTVIQKNGDWEYNKDIDPSKHSVSEMGDLKNAVEYKGETNSSLLKASVEENVYTREAIAKMSPEEFAKNENEIMRQLANGQIKDSQPDYSGYQNSSSTENQSSKKEPWSTNIKPKIIKTNSANDDNVVGYVWVASAGSCEACQDLDGEIFESEDDIPEIPHPNCNCTVERIIANKNQRSDDDDDDDDDDNEDNDDEEESDNQTYNRNNYNSQNPNIFNFFNNI